MANAINFKETSISIGDTISIDYKIKEGEKTRIQEFKGILMKIKGMDENMKMITVRKMSKNGIGIERIIPLASPFISDIKVVKTSSYRKARLNFIRDLSDQKLRRKLYKQPKTG
jgi:large subunit ribosomal protein L19